MFPDCALQFRLAETAHALGAPIRGELEITTKSAIPRAKSVIVFYAVAASATHGPDARRSTRKELARVVTTFDVEPGGLPAGTRRYPLDFAPPPGLPPTCSGRGLSVEHRIEARVDVDWALDPADFTVLNVHMPPTVGERRSPSFRTPADFHDELAFDVVLATDFIVEGDAIHGTISSCGRGRFDGLVVEARHTSGLSDRPIDLSLASMRIPADQLTSGARVPFTFSPDERMTPTFVVEPFCNGVTIRLTAETPWAINPSVQFPVHVLPRGSVTRFR